MARTPYLSYGNSTGDDARAGERVMDALQNTGVSAARADGPGSLLVIDECGKES